METVYDRAELERYREQLIREEKRPATVAKYVHDARVFANFLDGREATKELALAYKETLVRSGYAVRSINSMLAATNHYLGFLGKADCRVKSIRTQNQVYCSGEKMLMKAEYEQLLKAARTKPRLQLLLEMICSTGIRVSELAYFTVEAVRRGEVVANNKNKVRTILIPGKLQKKLLRFAKETGIEEGVLFCTASGRPMDRSNIWRAMKRLGAKARIQAGKVFPHNLRKLFARMFYRLEKDIVKLADILGHSNLETTRLYIMSTGLEHRRKLERLGLVT